MRAAASERISDIAYEEAFNDDLIDEVVTCEITVDGEERALHPALVYQLIDELRLGLGVGPREATITIKIPAVQRRPIPHPQSVPPTRPST